MPITLLTVAFLGETKILTASVPQIRVSPFPQILRQTDPIIVK